MLPVEQPFKAYTGLDGQPLSNGFVYFGVPNLDPINNPVPVFWDAAGTQPAYQPLRTMGGYIMNNGTPANVFCVTSYSELVQTKSKVQVFYARDSSEFSIATSVSTSIVGLSSALLASMGSSLVGYIQSGAKAVALTVLKKLRLAPPDVEDFGAIGDGVADDWQAITDALDAMKTRGGNVTLRMTKRYRITKGIKIPANVFIEGPMPTGTPFNNASPAPAIVADFTDPNQWVIEPRTTNADAVIPYNVTLAAAPDGFCFNVGVKNLLITSVGVTPYGGIRMHGCPGAFVEGVSIVGTGIGLLINESYGARYQVRTLTLYYGVIAWCEVNACSLDAYCTQADPKPRTVPDAYLFSGLSAMNGSMINRGLSTETHYHRPFGMVFGAQDDATSSNNDIGFTSEYFDGGVFMSYAKSVSFSRLYVEGGAGEVSFAVVASNSSFSSDATHVFMKSSGTLFDIGAVAIIDLNLNGVISYANFKPAGTIPNSSRVVVRGVRMAGALFTIPEVNVTFPDDGGDWIAPTLLNGWTSAASPNAAIAYRLNPSSREVELKGVPIGGTENTPVFLLPPGYRPIDRVELPVSLFGATVTTGNVFVLGTGEVQPVNTGMSANGFSLRGIRFRPEH